MRRPRSIRASEMEMGITRILWRVNDYVGDSERLVNIPQATQGTFQNAAILATFAIEELGKAVILKERLEATSGVETINVEPEVFEEHQHKQTAAFGLIDSSLRRLHRAGFGANFGPDFDIQNTDISPSTRLTLTFIDYKDGNWSYPPLVEPFKLKRLIEGIKDAARLQIEAQRERLRDVGEKNP